MKIIHTSDWHLGRTLYGRRCHTEFADFLNWLLEEIENQAADTLLIAGDIFDTSTPSNRTQELYYSFLHRVSLTCCRHIIIIGGNHDSPSLLNAPKRLLTHLNISVVGSITDTLADEVIPLYDTTGKTEAIVLAVPYLRDRDVRKAESGESIDDKAKKLVNGICEHYQKVVDIACQKRETLGEDIPIIAMGHLFTSGGKIADNGEVRDLYVGSLAHVHSTLFPAEIDYLALGHLHIAQRVQQLETMRYSGSPLPFSFGENNQQKSITLVTLEKNQCDIEILPVPQLLSLRTIRGNSSEILALLQTLINTEEKTLLEIIYTGNDIAALQEDLDVALQNTQIELIRTVNKQLFEISLQQSSVHETLEDLDEVDVFRRCLDAHEIPPREREELEFCFSEILQTLNEDDEEKR